MPPYCQFALASQKPVNLKNMGAVCNFNSNDLMFTATELRILLANQFPHATITPKVAALFLEKTKGWPLVAILGCSDKGSLLNFNVYPVFEDIWAEQDDPVQAFLLKTAWLAAFNPQFCREVLGAGDWQSPLQHLLTQRSLIFYRLI